MSGVTFGDKPCIDPVALWEDARAIQPPLPTPWWGKANSFRTAAGGDPGRGWLLLHRGQLDSLDREAAHDLVFSHGRTVTVTGIRIVSADCVVPRERGNKQSAYLVEVADARHQLQRFSPLVDRAYNVRTTSGGTYLTATTNSGTAWTWTQLVADLWTTVGTSRLGSYPGLPFAPHGTPEGFEYYQQPAYSALNDVLTRLACVLTLNPFTGIFGIARVGSTDAALSAAELRWDGVRLADDDPLEPAVARLPQYVRVLFRRRPEPTDGSSPWYSVDVADVSPATGAVAGGYQLLHDDLDALGATGTPSNSATLASRAAERAADWFREVKEGWTKLRRVYRDVLPEPGFAPGPKLLGLGWEDRGLGHKTEVRRGPGTVWRRQREWDGDRGDDGFWARLTAVAPSGVLWRYSFVEVEFDTNPAVATTKTGGRSGTYALDPAYEVGANSTLPADPEHGAVVWMRHNGLHYYFYEVEETFPVRLSARSSAAYSWVEQKSSSSGAWSDRPGGRSSALSAYELNLREDVPYGPAGTGAIVWLKLRWTDPSSTLREWGFQYETPAAGGGGGGTTIINIDITNTNITIEQYITNLFTGVINVTYFIRNGDVVNVFQWLCFDDVCGWFDWCTCEWLPPPSGSGSGSGSGSDAEMPWWCVPIVEGGSGSGGGGDGWDGCLICPDGSSSWSLTVPATGSFAGSPFGDLAGTWTLTWLGVALNGNPDCWWSSAASDHGGEPRWDLLYLEGTGKWWLQGKSASGNAVTFAVPHAAWQCCGDNTLTLVGGSTAFSSPTTLTVEPLGDCPESGSGSGSGTITGYRCVQSETMPAGAVSGPYDTREECAAICNSGSGSGSGPGSGGSGDVNCFDLICCPNQITGNLVAMIENKTGSAVCLPDQVSLTRGIGEPNWGNPTVGTGCSSTSGWSILCDSGTGQWSFSMTNICSNCSFDSVSCDPLELVRTGLSSSGIAGGAPGTFDIRIVDASEGSC